MPDAAPFSFSHVTRGDPAAVRAQQCPGLQNELDRAAGRYVVVCFHLSGQAPWAGSALRTLGDLRARFSPDHVALLAVGVRPEGEDEARLRTAHPDIVLVRDFERKAARLFGAMPREATDPAVGAPARPCWIVIDPTQHVLANLPCTAEGREGAAIAELLSGLPPPDRYSPIDLPPPILILPNVFEPELCRALIDTYERHGGQETGISVNAEVQIDHSRKRRRDCRIDDPAQIAATHHRLRTRIAPEIKRLFFLEVARVDRNIVACYAAEDEAHFMMAHRDNNSPATAYRRFAVSINLTDDFEGGCVRFPEYSQRDYKAPAGWALVFPCAILHQVTKVTAGRRYVFLPFVFE